MIPKIGAFPTRNHPALPPRNIFLLNLKLLTVPLGIIIGSLLILTCIGCAGLRVGGATSPVVVDNGVIGVAIGTTDFGGRKTNTHYLVSEGIKGFQGKEPLELNKYL